MPLTYSAPAVSITLKIIESYGIDTHELLTNLNIDPRCIEDPNARFPYTKIDQLWFDAVNIANDPAFGLRAARYWHPSQLGALGYAWLASTSLRSALGRLSRFMSILTEGAILEVEERGDELSACLRYKEISRQQPTRTDSFMAMLLAMCQANAGDNFHPSSIALTHEEPDDSSEFYTLFRCPIHFAAKENRFNLSLTDADNKLVSANPKLSQISDHLIIDALAKLDTRNFVAQVSAEIYKQLSSGNMTDATIASALNVSQRSLQRKLQQEGTTYKQILNELRCDLAKKYIQDSHQQLIEVAFMLGYSEYSSFSRAFKNWTGLSPKDYRTQAECDPDTGVL